MPKLLLVDDDPNLIEMMIEPLESEGFTVLTAANGEEGLERFHSGRPDIILTDLNMPKMNGIDFITEVRKTDPNIPIVILTGDAIKNTIQLAVSEKMGADLSLPKPLDPTSLIDKIRAVKEIEKGCKSKPRALVVDDEEDIRDFLVDALDLNGIESIQAKDGVEALNLFTKNDFDVIITDIYMPNMNGLELIQKIREINTQVPIVTISGASEDSLRTTKALGANETFQKPFNPSDIVSCLLRLSEAS